jgi:hypothetical protein
MVRGGQSDPDASGIISPAGTFISGHLFRGIYFLHAEYQLCFVVFRDYNSTVIKEAGLAFGIA